MSIETQTRQNVVSIKYRALPSDIKTVLSLELTPDLSTFGDVEPKVRDALRKQGIAAPQLSGTFQLVGTQPASWYLVQLREALESLGFTAKASPKLTAIRLWSDHDNKNFVGPRALYRITYASQAPLTWHDHTEILRLLQLKDYTFEAGSELGDYQIVMHHPDPQAKGRYDAIVHRALRGHYEVVIDD